MRNRGNRVSLNVHLVWYGVSLFAPAFTKYLGVDPLKVKTFGSIEA